MTVHCRLTGTLDVVLPPVEAFRLFTPRGEEEWVAGWRPHFPADAPDDTEPGTVFETHAHGDDATWVDHTDLRPTILTLSGLSDDYRHDGRVITEILDAKAIPQSLRAHRQTLERLGAAYKQINAPLGRFGLDVIKINDTAVRATDDAASVDAEATVANVGERAGAEVVQCYLLEGPDGVRQRLLGFERVVLEPGETARVAITADPRLLARYRSDLGGWHIEPGDHAVSVSRSAADHEHVEAVNLVGGVIGG